MALWREMPLLVFVEEGRKNLVVFVGNNGTVVIFEKGIGDVDGEVDNNYKELRYCGKTQKYF